jgi:hypothetical protein
VSFEPDDLAEARADSILTDPPVWSVSCRDTCLTDRGRSAALVGSRSPPADHAALDHAWSVANAYQA